MEKQIKIALAGNPNCGNNALGRGHHFRAFEYTAGILFVRAEHQRVLNGLMAGSQQVIGWQAAIFLLIPLKGTGMDGGNHLAVFGHGIVAVGNGTFQDFVAPFLLTARRGHDERAIVVPEGIDKGLPHG